MLAQQQNSADGSRRRTVALLTGLFILLTALFTYPISTAPDTYLKDLADSRLVTWTLAWNAHAIVNEPLNIFDGNIYFPSEGALAWSETFLAPSLLVAPLNWAGHPVLAYNLVLLSSFVLSGVGAALWVRHMSGSLSAGIVAGVVWALAPGKFSQIAHLHMMVGQWIPFALLYCSRFVASGRPRHLLVMTAFVGLQIGFSLHYGVFLLPILAIYAALLLRLLPESALRARLVGIPRLALGAGAVAVLIGAAAMFLAGGSSEASLERSLGEMQRYSARPWSFLAGSPFNQAAHARWLFERYEVVEANYFAGLLPMLLAAGALLIALPLAVRGRDIRTPSDGIKQKRANARSRTARVADRPVGRPPARESSRPRAVSMVGLASGAIAALALILHFGAIASAWQGGSASATRLLGWNASLHPALIGAVMALVALLSIPASVRRRLSSRGAHLIAISYLALLAYLLAYGPVVQAFDVEIGYGPYWLLYRYFAPFQAIRSVGRIGFLWILFVAALSGFAVAGAEARLAATSNAGGTRGSGIAWRLAMVALVVGVLWEYRVAPLPHERADPAADPADVWLASQPEDFAVVHAPIGTGNRAWTETAYMFGSTLHWKRLVNGYARSAPASYLHLTATPPLDPEFFRRLRAGFRVRYLLVHEDRLADGAQRAQLERLIAPNNDAVFVTQLGYTLVFEVLSEGGPGARGMAAGEPPFRLGLQRSYVAEELRGRGGVELSIRGSELTATSPAIALAGWGARAEALALSNTWARRRFDLAEGYIDALQGGEAVFALSTHTLLPVGSSGALTASGFTLDAQRQGTVVGLGNRVFHESESPAIQVHVLEEYGVGIAQTSTFDPGPAGAAEMLRHLESLPSGTLVAASLRFEPAARLAPEARAALRLIGVLPPADEEVSLMVVLGERGAAAGSAMQQLHHDRATIDIEGPTPVVQVRELRLF